MTANAVKNPLDHRFSFSSGQSDGLRWLRYALILYWFALTYLLVAPDPLSLLRGTTGVDEIDILSTPDLVQHFLALGILGILLACQTARNSMITPALVIAIVYSMGTECVQLFVPNRFASVLDTLANLSGLLAGWGGVQFFRGMAHSRKTRTSSVVNP